MELIEDLVRDQGVDTVSLYRNGPFTDLCRGPARARAPSGSRPSSSPRWRAPTGAGTPTARCSPASTARPSSRQGRTSTEHLERLEEARARDHRKLGRELGLFMLSDVAPGMPFWLPKGTHVWNELTRPLAHEQRGARLHRGAHADPLRRRALEEVRPLARLPRQHVLHGRRGAADGPQADELPGARPDLQARAALLPRPADPLRRAGARAPPRAERHPARPAARAQHHPGRRPRVLHGGADRGGGPALPRLRLLHLRPVRLRAAARAVHAPREAGGHRGDVGQGRGRAAAQRSRAAASSTT